LIENVETAEFVSKLLLNLNSQLNESVERVKRGSSPDEFTTYRRCIGRLINSIFEDIFEPLYAKHPIFKPRSWKRSYFKVQAEI
jgi:hypothetical protein